MVSATAQATMDASKLLGREHCTILKHSQIYVNVDNTEYDDVLRRSALHTHWCTHPERRKMHCVETLLYANSIILSSRRSRDSCYNATAFRYVRDYFIRRHSVGRLNPTLIIENIHIGYRELKKRPISSPRFPAQFQLLL